MIRVDRMDKRILGVLSQNLQVDAEGIGALVGCLPEVVRERVARLQNNGVIQGYHVQVGDDYLPPHEMLVAGKPTEATTPEAIAKLCSDPDVMRVFSMAASASMAFFVRGDDASILRRHAARLAKDAGLIEHQAILLVKAFHHNLEAGAPWSNQTILEAAP